MTPMERASVAGLRRLSRGERPSPPRRSERTRQHEVVLKVLREQRARMDRRGSFTGGPSGAAA